MHGLIDQAKADMEIVKDSHGVTIGLISASGHQPETLLLRQALHSLAHGTASVSAWGSQHLDAGLAHKSVSYSPKLGLPKQIITSMFGFS
eukprot:2356882-Amphidinium_carterae.1